MFGLVRGWALLASGYVIFPPFKNLITIPLPQLDSCLWCHFYDRWWRSLSGKCWIFNENVSFFGFISPKATCWVENIFQTFFFLFFLLDCFAYVLVFIHSSHLSSSLYRWFIDPLFVCGSSIREMWVRQKRCLIQISNMWCCCFDSPSRTLLSTSTLNFSISICPPTIHVSLHSVVNHYIVLFDFSICLNLFFVFVHVRVECKKNKK